MCIVLGNFKKFIDELFGKNAAGNNPFSRNKIINKTKYSMPIMEGFASVS